MKPVASVIAAIFVVVLHGVVRLGRLGAPATTRPENGRYNLQI